MLVTWWYEDEANKGIHGQRLMETLADGAYVWFGRALLFSALIYFRGPVRLRVENVENVPHSRMPVLVV